MKGGITVSCYPYQSYGHGPAYMYAAQCDMDEAYMMQMYPEACRIIQRYAEHECIRRERMGQLPYDAYPSKAVVYEMVEEVYKKCKPELLKEHKDRQPNYSDRDNIFRDLIAIILLAELFRRRRLFRRRYYLGY